MSASPEPHLGNTVDTLASKALEDCNEVDQDRDIGIGPAAAAEHASRSSMPPSPLSDNAELVRRLNRLNGRVLKVVQARIAAMEDALDNLDAQAGTAIGREEEGGDSVDTGRPREDMVDALVSKLRNYNEFVAACAMATSSVTQTHRRLNTPGLSHSKHRRDLSPARSYAANDDAICDDDDDSPVNELRLRLASALRRSWHASQSKSAALGTFLGDPHVRDVASSTCILGAGVGVLFVPMWWLDAVDDGVKRLGTLTGLVVFLTTVLQRGVRAKAYEVLGAAAAYTLMFIFFLQSPTK